MNNNQLHVKEFGEGKPIYFFHGLALDMTSMIETYEPIFAKQTGFRRIYIDLPGMGLSPIVSHINNSDDVLGIVKEFIINDSKNESIVLCGHSYGGYLCQGLVYELREKVTSFFLTCPVVIANHEFRTLEKHQNLLIEDIKKIENQESYQDYLNMNVVVSNYTWKKYQNLIIPGLDRFDNSFWDSVKDTDYSFSFENQLSNSLNEQQGTILVGEFDHITGFKDHFELYGDLLNVELVKNSGHNLFIDQYDVVKESFQSFLEKL